MRNMESGSLASFSWMLFDTGSSIYGVLVSSFSSFLLFLSFFGVLDRISYIPNQPHSLCIVRNGLGHLTPLPPPPKDLDFRHKLSQLNRHCHLSGIPIVLSVQSASDTATFLNLSYLWIWVTIHGRDIPAVVGGHLVGAHCLLHQWVLEIELRSSGLVRSILTQDISYLMPHPASFRLFWCAFQFNMPNFVHF